MYYGQSGTGKSESLLAIIRAVYEATGKKARVYVGDGSAATYLDSGLVDLGIIELFSWEGRDWPISTLDQMAEGYKPADFEKPFEERDPKAPLIPPTPEDMAKIGVWGFEGISVAGTYILGDAKGGFAYRAGRGEKIGQDSPISLVDADLNAAGKAIPGTGSGRVYGGNPLSHFQHAQKRLLGILERSKSLPGEFVIWTGHERGAEDKVTKESVIGPEAAGSALTASLQRIFGNALHHVTVEKRRKVKDEHTERMVEDLDVEFRIYTRDHISPTTMTKYKAVTRGGLVEPDMPLYLTSETPGAAIIAFYERLRAARMKRIAEAEERYKPKATEAA